MKSAELRQKFLEFFEKKGHKVIPSASLVPENDPTVLFATAGMHPLVPYLLGQKHPEGNKLASCQKCIRTVDIDNVGDDAHLTFFEMLGNWSLGDYWKEDAIKWSFEFLTKELKISLERLAVSCFAGDIDAPKDEESAKIWEKLGIKKERIVFLQKEDNWWGPAGKTGPCGPDTEMFYWKPNGIRSPKIFDPEDKNLSAQAGWVEIWNDVFMQYAKDENGNYMGVSQKNVDTGMGLERTIAVLNGKENVYETDLFLPIIEKIEELSHKKYEDNKKEFRIIADHIKASVFLASAGVEPSNIGRGYILRRLLRRAIRYGKALQMPENFLIYLIKSIVLIYKEAYPELANNEEGVIFIVRQESEKFERTLEGGLREFGRLAEFKIKNGETISGVDAFNLYQTYGYPIEILQELAEERGIKIDVEEFKKELEKHQELSRTASAGMFKGGLADASFQTTKLHTAAHIMLAGLRKVLRENVVQKGSNITAERLRFDFSYKEKMTKEQIVETEEFVNGIINKDLPVSFEEVTLEKARELNAMGVFELKYGQMVKVYTIGQGEETVSREICGGPHVERTGILGHFKIQKEESSSSGIRRIKATLE